MIKDRVKELLKMVDLPISYSSMYPHELSGGQETSGSHSKGSFIKTKNNSIGRTNFSSDVLIQGTVIDLLWLKKELGPDLYFFISHDPESYEKFL